MKRHILLLVCLFICLSPLSSVAHPGDIDANGGHYDYSTGEYHYHHGYPAHYHKNGTCPYDFDDRTGANSGTPGNGTSYSWYTTAPRPYSSPVPSSVARSTDNLSFFQKHPFLITAGIIIASISIWIVIAKKKEEERLIREREQYERERQEKIAFYSTRNLRYLTNMPDIYYVDDKNIPYEYNIPKGYKYGVTLDVYITSSSSEVYHRRGCTHLTYHMPHNACSDERIWRLSSKRPCSICRPDPLPDIKWYNEYLDHIKTCEQYGIKPKLNPAGFSPPPPPAEPSPSEQPVSPLPTKLDSNSISPSRPPRRITAQPDLTTVTIKPSLPKHETIPSAATLPPTSPVLHLTPEPSADDIPDYSLIYRRKYPATWAYIQHNAQYPQDYIYYYHYVWGKLQEHHGDGIIYGSLSEDQQKLVNYLPLGDVVYLSSTKSDKYHATPECYSLLKSAPFSVKKDDVLTKQRCTKCVPPN